VATPVHLAALMLIHQTTLAARVTVTRMNPAQTVAEEMGVTRVSLLLKIALISSLLLTTACEDSIKPTPVPAKEKKAFEKNATDAAGVAEGDEQISPFGKPSH